MTARVLHSMITKREQMPTQSFRTASLECCQTALVETINNAQSLVEVNMIAEKERQGNPKCALHRVLIDWYEYSGEPIEKTVAKVNRCKELMSEEWRTTVTANEDKQILKFYSKSDFYVYEILLAYLYPKEFAKEANQEKMISFCKQLRRERNIKALEFGGGTGELCLSLWDTGIEVTYCDLPGRISDFAKWRFRKYCANIDVRYSRIDGVDLPPDEYDLIVSDAVFEHLKREHVRSFLRSISQSLKNGGYFYLLWDPSYSTVNPTHILGLTRIDTLMAGYGLLRFKGDVYRKVCISSQLLLGFGRALRAMPASTRPLLELVLPFISKFCSRYLTTWEAQSV